MESNRQVFTYFLNKETSVSEYNPEELKSIEDFKEYYREKVGIDLGISCISYLSVLN